MQDMNAVPAAQNPSAPLEADGSSGKEVVSTHVLVSEEQVEALRELSRKTRVAQSEYLREAVEDLLNKYATVLGDKR
ncbi:MAG: ribbon-helix-helix domain-containing protein [Archangiaceae bacterium]|nr:ribbon-helix-helix domain-containing protein [Archangiaceae bacterium]